MASSRREGPAHRRGGRAGRPPGGVYVNSYNPSSLVAFVCRVAILATHESYSEFAERGGWKTVGGLESDLDRADRVLVERVQQLVNRSPSRIADVGQDRFYLLAFYDSVTGARRPRDRRGGSSDLESERKSQEQTEGGLPAHYFLELCNAGPARSKPEVIIRGLAMRAFLREQSGQLPDALAEVRYDADPPLPALEGSTVADAVAETIRDLCIVAGHPPATGGGEATRLLAEAGTLAIDAVREQLLSGSPMAWRLTRVVTECLRRRDAWGASGGPNDPRHPGNVVRASAALLEELHALNPPCIYRARSLWEEAVGHLPKTNTDGLEKFGPMLRQRALVGTTGNTDYESPLPVRERITAAWVYVWRTARIQGWEPSKLEPLRDALGPETKRVLATFADELLGPEQHPSSNGDVRDRGLRYAGEYIHTMLDDQIFWFPFGANESIPGERRIKPWWHQAVEATIVEASIERVLDDGEEFERLHPAGLLVPACGALVSQACLTIDGVSRRESLVTLEYAGLGDIASAMFSRVIDVARDRDPVEYRWLIENATFGLGWMASPHRSLDRLLGIAGDPALDPSIRMTALMAVGDMSDDIRGLDRLRRSAGSAARQVVEGFPSTFTAPSAGDALIFEHKALVRSATYVLAMLRDPAHRDVLQQVASSLRFEESTTPALAQWGLDRIDAREAVNDAWREAAPDSSHRALRRLVDPMRSLASVQVRRRSAD